MAYSGRIRFVAETGLKDLIEETESGASSARAHTLLNSNFTHVITLDVAPSSDWEAGDVITGQTSGATCEVVGKLTSTTYTVKNKVGTYTLGEEIGVTGTALKLADQGATRPIFTAKDREGTITYTYAAAGDSNDGRDITISAYTAPSETFVP